MPQLSPKTDTLLEALLPRLQTTIPDKADRQVFRGRLQAQFPRLIAPIG